MELLLNGVLTATVVVITVEEELPITIALGMAKRKEAVKVVKI